MKKMWYICTTDYYSAFKNEGNSVIGDDVDKPRGYYAEWNKPVTEVQIWWLYLPEIFKIGKFRDWNCGKWWPGAVGKGGEYIFYLGPQKVKQGPLDGSRAKSQHLEDNANIRADE